MITYVVDLAERSYPIHIGSGALSMLGAELQRLKATRALKFRFQFVSFPTVRNLRISGT